MKRLGSVAIVVSALLGCEAASTLPPLPVVEDPCAEWTAPGLYQLPLGDDWSRQPIVYVPAGVGPRDAVVMLHGAGGTAERMIDLTTWLEKSEADNLVAIFPNGTGVSEGYTWNAGTCCGWAERYGVPDVAFLDAIHTVAEKRLCLDRVLAAGHSNGSMMVHRWGCEGDNPPTAIVGSSGPLLLDTCEGDPIPVQHWHGTADPRVPYAGGVGPEGESFPAVEDAMALWRKRNGCGDSPGAISVNGDTTCYTWTCTAPTRLCAVEGWGHAWPGRLAGRVSRPEPPWIEDEALSWFLELPTEAVNP